MKGIWMIAMSGYLVWLSVWDIKRKRIPVYLLGIEVVLTGACALYMCIVKRETWYMPFLGTLPGVFLLAGARLTNQVGMADGIVIAQLGAMVGGWNILFVFFFCVYIIVDLSAKMEKACLYEFLL